MGDGALHDPALRRSCGQRKTLRSRADCHRHISQEGVLLLHAGTSPRLHLERGESQLVLLTPDWTLES